MPADLPCPFCALSDDALVLRSELVLALRDRHPVSPGHTLVIPRRHVETYFDATPAEQAALWRAVDDVKRALDGEIRPDGYNVGFNAGVAAGQTVMHLHVHVIPRFRGDMDDPRGGVRHVIPSRGNYLRAVPPLATGGERDPFSAHILPLAARATKIDVVAAFVQLAGVERLRPALLDAIRRGARVRLLTGDYLHITQVEALELLLDWLRLSAAVDDDEPAASGTLAVRVVEVERLPGRTRTFHPKAWRFEGPGFGTAFVGSSNLSWAALETGIEWNLRVDRDADAAAYARVCDAFEAAWTGARPLDEQWVAAYARRAAERPLPLPFAEVDDEPLPSMPEPHEVQREALAALARSRSEGRQRALVVLATGLGKTWLAVLDVLAFMDEVGRPPRVLFLAHRRELLRQAARAFRAAFHARGLARRVGWFLEDADDLSADVVFASIAKLSRPEHVARLAAERFDYVVVDEVHHATAGSYRRILDAINPPFLLGLTATPDRADEADVAGLFDDHVAFRADVGRGIAIGRLVPFAYFGVCDDIDYANIPWRNRRFEPEALASAVETVQRMETLWDAWQAHPGSRTLVFCCSQSHARFAKTFLEGRGVRARAVFAGERSDEREGALAALDAGSIDAICAVDLFNEGVDVPRVDRVVMLRPTESGVVYLQQLGRGLRRADGKDRLTVIDFVGNHRVFLERVRTLLSLVDASPAALRALLEATDAVGLPHGCSVDLELEAKDVLRSLLGSGAADEVERAFRELLAARGTRPTAGELYRLGFLPSRLKPRHASWFEFVASVELDGAPALEADERAAIDAARDWLVELETTDMTKSFKMVALEAVLESDHWLAGVELDELARRSHAILRRSPELFADVLDRERFDVLDETNEAEWRSYWRKNPIAAWLGENRAAGKRWFRLEGSRLVPNVDVAEPLLPAFSALTRELVDYRLAQYRARKATQATASELTCKVTWNQRDPILKLPSRAQGGVPSGDLDVRLDDGAVWRFRLQKEFCNVARPTGTQHNALPDLLRRWFGPSAGKPGTNFHVVFERAPDGWWGKPVGAKVLAFPLARRIRAYPDLRAAAGVASEQSEAFEPEDLVLPTSSAERASTDAREGLFAVRVAGTSMDGGSMPLRNGDWVVLQYARGAAISAVENRVALVEIPGEPGSSYQLKRIVRRGERWVLASDNPAGPQLEAKGNEVPIALFVERVRPEDIGPPAGAVLSAAELGPAFGIDEPPSRTGRYGGHLFLFVGRGAFPAPDRVEASVPRRRPGETAFVVAPLEGGSFRCCGVGRYLEGEGLWAIPELDFASWRALSTSREASRRLPAGALEKAAALVARVLADGPGLVVTSPDGQSARVVGRAARGGVRIEGDGWAKARTVSLVDIAWVLVAAEHARASGGLVDNGLVDRLRYLRGTPTGSTRFIDTGWSIGLFHAARS